MQWPCWIKGDDFTQINVPNWAQHTNFYFILCGGVHWSDQTPKPGMHRLCSVSVDEFTRAPREMIVLHFCRLACPAPNAGKYAGCAPCAMSKTTYVSSSLLINPFTLNTKCVFPSSPHLLARILDPRAVGPRWPKTGRIRRASRHFTLLDVVPVPVEWSLNTSTLQTFPVEMLHSIDARYKLSSFHCYVQ